MATISDVAKLSGMSVATVSRVINDKPHVSEKNKKKVLDAMEQLGYTPLQAARQMRGSGSNNIAVAVPTITNSFFAYLVDSIEQTAREYEFRTLITQTNGDKYSEAEALGLMKQHHADGIILCAIENDWSLIKSFENFGKIVVCNEYNADESISMIQAKQYEGFLEATNYLLKTGRKKIAYCTGTHAITMQATGINIDSDRYNGYMQGLMSVGLTVNPKWVFTQIHTSEDGRKIIQKLLKFSERPDAIIAGSDEVAAGMVMEAIAAGIKIPEELAIMGVDDQPLANYLQIPLTTIRQPIVEEGKYAAKELIGLIGGDITVPSRKKLNLELVIRATA